MTQLSSGITTQQREQWDQIGLFEGRVGVVGHTGFIGRAIIVELEGLEFVPVRLPRVDLEGDFDTSVKDYAPHLAGLDVVINAAGAASPDSVDGETLSRLNVDLPLVVAKAAERAGLRRLVHISSAAVQGDRSELDWSDDRQPVSPYGRSKAEGERRLGVFGQTADLEICCYRPTSVQGTARKTTQRLANRLSNRWLPMIGDGSAPLPLTTAQSVARFAVALANQQEPLPPIVNHPWEQTTQADAYRLLGGRTPRFAIPQPLVSAGLGLGGAVARRSNRISGPWRRVELLLRGQPIAIDLTGTVPGVDVSRTHAELGVIGEELRKGQPATKVSAFMLSELYWPETTSTGNTMTLMAEAMAPDVSMSVLTVPPTYSQAGTAAARNEVRNGVTIRRLRAIDLGRSSHLARVASGALITASLLLELLRRAKRGDIVLVVSNPFVLPFGASVVAKVRGLQLVLITHDLFPDTLVAADLITPQHPLRRLLGTMSTWLYRNSAMILSIGDAQAARIRELAHPAEVDVRVVLQAADELQATYPSRLESSFQYDDVPATNRVIQVAGNLGPFQDIDALAEALVDFEMPDNVTLVFVGGGRSREALQRRVDAGLLPFVRLVDSVPRDEAGEMHQSCDVSLVMLRPGMVGVSVPSRIGNALAAGRPVIAMTGSGSELETFTNEYDLGWVVEPRDWSALLDAFKAVGNASCQDLAAMGARSATVARTHFCREAMDDSYQVAIRALLAKAP